MPKHTDRVRIEEVDWQAVFPWLRLLGAFKMAMQPGKLMASLLLIVLLFLAGSLLDLFLAKSVHAGEFNQYRLVHFGLQSESDFAKAIKDREAASRVLLGGLLESIENWKGDTKAITGDASPYGAAHAAIHEHFTKAYAQKELDREQTKFEKDWDSELKAIRQARTQTLAKLQALRPTGAFDAALKQTLESSDRLMRAIVTFNFGFSQATAAGPLMEAGEGGGETTPLAANVSMHYHDQTTALSALRDLLIILPCWLWHHHTALLLAFLFIALIFTAILGGAVARMAALHATRDDRASLRESLRFVLPRWWSFLLTPLVPLLLVGAVALLMGLGGAVLFNPPAWGIDIVGGLLFVVAILCGIIVMGTLVLSAAGIHLVYPATAVNGSDLFDAIARAFNYVLNRPWRWLFYNAIVVLQGCIMYLLLTLALGLVIAVVQQFTGMWVFTTTDLGGNRFEAILPASPLTGLSYEVDYASLDWSGKAAAFLVRCWMFLTIGLLPAFAVSFYFSANTWIYILLRRDADGIEVEDVLIDPPVDPNAPAKRVEEAEPAKETAEEAE